MADEEARGGAKHPGALGSSNVTLGASVPAARPRRGTVPHAAMVAAARPPARRGRAPPRPGPTTCAGAARRATGRPRTGRTPPAPGRPGSGATAPPLAAATVPRMPPRSRPCPPALPALPARAAERADARAATAARAPGAGAPSGLEPATAPGRRRRDHDRSPAGCPATALAEHADHCCRPPNAPSPGRSNGASWRLTPQVHLQSGRSTRTGPVSKDVLRRSCQVQRIVRQQVRGRQLRRACHESELAAGSAPWRCTAARLLLAPPPIRRHGSRTGAGRGASRPARSYRRTCRGTPACTSSTSSSASPAP